MISFEGKIFRKMSRAQAESVIKNIIREIAQECANKGQAVSETLVAFMVDTLMLTKYRPCFVFALSHQLS